MKNQPAIFEEQQIRRMYDESTETWWFSVVDIIQVLTLQPDCQTARKYWNKLKERLGKEGSQLVTNCHQLEMEAAAKTGGDIAKKARLELEAKTGKKVVRGESYLPPSKRRRIEKK